MYLDRVKLTRQNLIRTSGGIGRRARLRFRPVCDFIVDYGFSVFIDED